MPEDLLNGPLAPRRHAGRGWQWLCWDGIVQIADIAGSDYGSLWTSLDGGASVVPLQSLCGRPVTNLRIAPPAPGKLRLTGQILAHGAAGARHARTLALDVVEAWRSHPGQEALEAESSTSEMLFRCDNPPEGSAWRMNFQKRWLAIQHLAVAPPGQIEQACNLLAGGLEGGALPRLETLPAGYSVRAARGFFSTRRQQVCYRSVQLGPLVYDMAFTIHPSRVELEIVREAMADCLAFEAQALSFRLGDATAAQLRGPALVLSAGGPEALLQARPPLHWRQGTGAVDLVFEDPVNDLGLLSIPAGRVRGSAVLEFPRRPE